MLLCAVDILKMYAKGGTGGQTGGGQAQGVGLSPSNQEAVKAQQIGMALQLAQLKSQIEVNESVAKKEADAKKTEGADTEYTRMLTELAKTEIDYKAMSTEEVAAKIKMWGDQSQLLMAEARKAASEADYNEKTMDNRVAKAGYETVNSMLENIQKMRNIEFTEAQTKAIAENIAIAWYNAGTNRMNATTAADHVANELMKITGDLGIRERTLLKDRKSTRLNSSHRSLSRMPSSA